MVSCGGQPGVEQMGLKWRQTKAKQKPAGRGRSGNLRIVGELRGRSVARETCLDGHNPLASVLQGASPENREFVPSAAAAERDARFGVSSIRLVVLQLTSATSEVLAALQ